MIYYQKREDYNYMMQEDIRFGTQNWIKKEYETFKVPQIRGKRLKLMGGEETHGLERGI